MSSPTPFARPTKTIVLYFLVLCAVAVTVAGARQAGLIGSPAEQRCLGLIIGAMAFAVGNSLPKVRPLQGRFCDAVQSSAAERLAGWTLALAGAAFLVLFTFFSLEEARLLSAIAGMSAVVLIAIRWIAVTVIAGPHGRLAADAPAESGRRTAENRMVSALLFTVLCLLGTACVTFLFGKAVWFGQVAMYAVATIFLVRPGGKRSARTQA